MLVTCCASALRSLAVCIVLAPCEARLVAWSRSCVAVWRADSAVSVSVLTTERLVLTCAFWSSSAWICIKLPNWSGASEGFEIFSPDETWLSAVLICDCTMDRSARNSSADGFRLEIIVLAHLLSCVQHVDGVQGQLIYHRDHFRRSVVCPLKLHHLGCLVVQRYARGLAAQIARLRQHLLLDVQLILSAGRLAPHACREVSIKLRVARAVDLVRGALWRCEAREPQCDAVRNVGRTGIDGGQLRGCDGVVQRQGLGDGGWMGSIITE